MLDSVNFGLDLIDDIMDILLHPPAIYFVGFAVIGAASGVTRKFVPIKRR